jgi:hypothetical protein
VEKCGTARQTTDDSTIRRILLACWINEATHTHTPNICNIYCFSTAATDTRRLLNVTFIRTGFAFFFMVLIVVSVYIDLLVFASRVKSLLYTD